MKTFTTITLVSCLFVTLTFGGTSIGQDRLDAFSKDLQRMNQLMNMFPTQWNIRILEEAKTILTRLNHQLQQIDENNNDAEIAKVAMLLDSSPLPSRRVHIKGDLNQILEQIYELLGQFNSRTQNIERKLRRRIIEMIERESMAELVETAKMSNKSGVPIVAGYYAATRQDNIALSPPNMVATYAALTHIAKGKTKQELQTLLSLDGNEKPIFNRFYYYVSDLILNDEPNRPYGYSSRGSIIINGNTVRISEKDVDQETIQKLVANFGTNVAVTDPSKTHIQMLNRELFQTFFDDFLDHRSSFFPSIMFVNPQLMMQEVQSLMGQKSSGEGYNIIQADRNMSMFVRPVGGVMDTLPDRDAEEGEECVMGVPHPFRFDTGSKDIDFFKVEVKEHQTVMVNGQTGYRIPLGVTDLTIVKCANGAALKQLANIIAKDGLQVMQGRKIQESMMLHIPQVDFDTELDLAQYAKTKGLMTPFTRGAAEYSLGSNASLRGVYCNDAKIACTFMVDCYGIIAWQQIVPDAVMRAYPMGRNQRLPNNIVIDSPYLLFLSDRKLDAVLGMAFIARPEQSEARKKHDQGSTMMFTVPK